MRRKAAIYCRVSTTEQAIEGHSISAQKNLLQAYAKNNGLQIVAEYIDEGASAKTAERLQFQLMISAAKQKPTPFEKILVHKYDRFARNREDSIVYKNLLRRDCGIDVVSITEPTDDSPVSKLMEGILEVMNEFYLLNLSAEVKKGMSEAASKGRALGTAPFGYRVDDGRYVLVEEEAAVVQWIFHEYVHTDKGTRELAKTLRFYGEDMFGDVAKKHKWSQPGITNILRNNTYVGTRTWGKRDTSKNHRIRPENDWVVAEAALDPIIDNDLFQAAQEQLASKKQQRSPSEDYLLRGLMRCGDCGATMSQFRTSWRRKNGERVWGTRRLSCNEYRNSGQCSVNSVAAEDIEASVMDALQEIVDGDVDPADLNIIFTSDTVSKRRVAELRSKLKSFKNRFDRQMEAYEAGVIELDELAAFKQRLSAERSEVEQELANSTDMTLQLEEGFNLIRQRARKLIAEFDSTSLDDKKTALAAVVHRVEYSKAKGSLNLVLKA